METKIVHCLVSTDKRSFLKDRRRPPVKYLEGLGLKVFHTTNFDVLQHVNMVLADLRKYIVENYEHEDYEKKE